MAHHQASTSMIATHNTARARTARNAIAQTAIVVTVTGLGALALAGPASAADRHVGVQDCHNPPGNQLCVPIETTSFYTDAPNIKVEYTAGTDGCSDAIVHTWVNGPDYEGLREWGSARVSPGQSDGGYEIPVRTPNGLVVVGVQLEGITGGCTVGHLDAWQGTIHTEVLYD
jgi:hypothetical protein